MDQSVCLLELLGLLFSAGAWLCSLATTMMSDWLTLSTDLLPAESYELGLWQTCVVQDGTGALECRPYDSLLGLPPDIRLARVLMCTAVATGLLASLLALPGLYVVNSCDGRLEDLATGLLASLLALPGLYVVNSCDGRLEDLRVKRAMKMAGGLLCLAAGVVGLVPVSYIAHLTVLRFHDQSVPAVVPRWDFGDALFCGWTAGFLHLVAGSLLLASCLCLQDDRCTHLPIPIPLMAPKGRSRSTSGARAEYV